MNLKRIVTPEWLDELSAGDPLAIRSRQDLRRVNFIMGHASLMARLLGRIGCLGSIRNLVELGAGDGTFLLRVARQVTPKCKGVRAVLVDRQAVVSVETRKEFMKLGWEIEVATMDIFEWLAHALLEKGTAMIANLFLHHFQDEELRKLLAEVALKTSWFGACEPRRSRLALTASGLLGLIGCNQVTRHDAVASVRAGFISGELGRLWPTDSRWQTEEGEAGLFSHFFVAGLIR